MFNTEVKATDGLVCITVEFEEQDLPKNPALFDEQGNRVAAHFTVPKKFKLPYDSFRVVYDTYAMDVEFIADISNGLSAKTFYVKDCDKAVQSALIATKGLYEYEVYRDGKNTMGITLLRAVGELGDWFYFRRLTRKCRANMNIRIA